ncbi:MAG: RnfABCDGE type electron transport complex subunit D [Oscillospiraceae bacterium]|nr:RnfABCDGE type electron transport complex subunit D [Oscillospiraceae bacterium]
MKTFVKPQKPKEFLETRKIMLSYTVLLSALALVSVYSYGVRALVIILISVATTTVCKKICEEISKSDCPHRDLSALAAGLMTALLMPVSVPLYIPFFTSVFAVVGCTVPFGTAKNSPFVPAAASFCFAALCFGEKVFAYPYLSDGIFQTEKTGTSLTALLSSGTSIKLNPAVVLEIITGQIPSGLGTGFVIMLFGALVFLLIRHPKNALPPIAFLFVSALVSLIFPRIRAGALTSLTMEMCGGMLLFSAVFFMSYPSVIPSRLLPSIAWGAVSGVVCMAFRHFGKAEDSIVFGILIMNATASLFDELPLTRIEKKKIDENTPYEETEEAIGVVPEDILNKIPDISYEEIIAQVSLSSEKNAPAEDLHTTFIPDNEIDEAEVLFVSGGDGNE